MKVSRFDLLWVPPLIFKSCMLLWLTFGASRRQKFLCKKCKVYNGESLTKHRCIIFFFMEFSNFPSGLALDGRQCQRPRQCEIKSGCMSRRWPISQDLLKN